jgi:hypothetical protein
LEGYQLAKVLAVMRGMNRVLCVYAGLNTLFIETFSLADLLLVVCVISGSTAKEIKSVFFWVIMQ